MTIYCKIEQPVADPPVIEVREEKSPTFVKDGSDGNPIWRPVVDPGAPVYNSAYQDIAKTETVDATQITVSYTVTDRVLDTVKTDHKHRLARDAERERLKYVTPGDGKAMVYLQKQAEVDKWDAAGKPPSPDAGEYPWASGRASRTSATIAAVLAEWEAKTVAWETIGRAIENTAEGGIDAIDAAADGPGVVAAYNAVVWP